MGGGLKFTFSIISTATKSTWNRSIKHKRTSSNSLNGYELRAFRFTWLKSTTYRLRLALLWMYSTPQPESRQEIIRAQGAWNPNHNSHTILHEDLAHTMHVASHHCLLQPIRQFHFLHPVKSTNIFYRTLKICSIKWAIIQEWRHSLKSCSSR